MEETLQEQRTIVILGMHRSGTSAITRVINYLGVDLGPSLLSDSEDNETGFWEHTEIVQLNEWLLQISGSCWEDVCLLPAEWWRSEAIVPIKQAMIEIIKKDFSMSPLWAIKDPRICRVLPVWHSIFTEISVIPLYLIVVRDPREIASSLMKRNSFTLEKSYLLWVTYMFEAERWTRGHNRVFISYKDLLDDWREVVEIIENSMQIQWPVRKLEIEHKIDDFLDPALRHHKTTQNLKESDLNIDIRLAQVVCGLYRALTAECEWSKGKSRSALSEYFDEVIVTKQNLLNKTCRKIVSSPDQQHLENTTKMIAAYFNSLNKEVTLIIPTRSREDETIVFIEDMVEKMKSTNTEVIILHDCTRNHETKINLKQLAERLNIDIIDYEIPFDITVLDRPKVKYINIIMHNYPYGHLAMLARYGNISFIPSDYGTIIFITFGKE